MLPMMLLMPRCLRCRLRWWYYYAAARHVDAAAMPCWCRWCAHAWCCLSFHYFIIISSFRHYWHCFLHYALIDYYLINIFISFFDFRCRRHCHYYYAIVDRYWLMLFHFLLSILLFIFAYRFLHFRHSSHTFISLHFFHFLFTSLDSFQISLNTLIRQWIGIANTSLHWSLAFIAVIRH